MADNKPAAEQVLNLPIDDLMPDPAQPRKSFLADEISRLADSVKARGILQPLRVLFDEERKKYRILIGESRWHAARMAGMTHLPCLPVHGQPSETDILSDQIIENTVRNSLRPIELARALAKLKALKKCTAQNLAAELGISGGAISKSESLLGLPPDVQAMIDSGRVSPTAAYEIARLPDEKSQRAMAEMVALGKVSRDQVADAVQQVVGKKSVKPKAARLPLRLDGGISVTITAGKKLTWDDFNTAFDRIRKEAKKLYENGRDIGDLAKLLRAS